MPKNEKQMNNKDQEIRLLDAPEYVGFWRLSDINFQTKVRPNRFHQFFCKLILGIEWYDR